MIPNRSPWIHQLARTRPSVPLSHDLDTDTAIVGGGIAGIATAYFTLRDTDQRVVLIEADKIAHGATGHNAGQITSYFERPLRDIAREYGASLAIDGQRSIESAWVLIDEILAEAKLQTPLYRFTGYAGLSTLDQVLGHLEDNRLRVEGGLPSEELLIDEEWEEVANIPKTYQGLYALAPQKDILALIESAHPRYRASLSYQKGCMNSALFCEELVGYLTSSYPERFSFYEASPVSRVRLAEKGADLSVLMHSVRAKRVVLCTNGFEHFHIEGADGEKVDTSFHHSVAGRVGYMSGYLAPPGDPPTAISYFGDTPDTDPTGENYFYLTRRPFEHAGMESNNLISTGGPDKVLPNGADYSREEACPEDMRALIDTFLRETYAKHPPEDPDYLFCWHGLMGYTPSGIRRVGEEPKNPVLLYNLGCNGVGILPSVFGGKRIAQILGGENLPPSIFDPIDLQEGF